MGEPVSETYNLDCMEYMRSLPDGAFDLAVVDPPYGDGSQTVHVERPGTGTTDSADGGTATKKYNRFGQRFDRYKDLAGGQRSIPRGGYHGKNLYHMGQPGQEEPGRGNTAKK